MSDASKNNKKWIVAMMLDVPGIDCNTSIGKIVKLRDPNTNENRDYGLMAATIGGNNNNNNQDKQCNKIVEFQSLPADFSSFIVGRHIVKDGNIYVVNRIDPLFFYLSTQSVDDGQQESWQPFDQNLENSKLPREVCEAIPEKQMAHICSTFSNDDVCYLKFNVEKTLKWLQKKQERLFESLIIQDQRNRKAKGIKYASFNNNRTGVTGGSMSANFNLPPQASRLVAATSCNEDKNSSAAELSNNTKAIKTESIQIMCNYLNQDWSKKFIEYLGCTMEVISTTNPTNKAAGVSNNVVSNAVIQQNIDDDISSKKIAEAKKKTIAETRTMGNKRLAKVSTKGMKSMSSFFGAAVKTKKAKH